MDHQHFEREKGSAEEWRRSEASVFWGKVAPCDHIIQIYESEGAFLDTLAGFVGSGINAGEGTIVIATESHLQALNRILAGLVVHVDTLIADDRYLPLNARDVLSGLMVDGIPDEERFNRILSHYIEKAGKKGRRRVRAFGEMARLLWAEGRHDAALRLEHLWNRLCGRDICLFCAYPGSGFAPDLHDSVISLCAAHSKVIAGEQGSLTKVMYRDVTAAGSTVRGRDEPPYRGRASEQLSPDQRVQGESREKGNAPPY